MDYTKLFYWLVVADNAKTMFGVFTTIFTIIAGIATIAYFITASDGSEDDQRMSRNWMWWSYPFMIVFLGLLILTPSKRDALLIVAGGQTLNFLSNDESAKQIPSELSGFILTELKNMAAEAQVELGVKTQKERILDEAKSLTTEELLKRMTEDKNFADIVLNNNK
jgi:hypothetical protein